MCLRHLFPSPKNFTHYNFYLLRGWKVQDGCAHPGNTDTKTGTIHVQDVFEKKRFKVVKNLTRWQKSPGRGINEILGEIKRLQKKKKKKKKDQATAKNRRPWLSKPQCCSSHTGQSPPSRCTEACSPSLGAAYDLIRPSQPSHLLISQLSGEQAFTTFPERRGKILIH